LKSYYVGCQISSGLRRFIIAYKWPLLVYAVITAIILPFTWQMDVYDWYYQAGEALSKGVNPYTQFNMYAIEYRAETGRWWTPPLTLLPVMIAYSLTSLSSIPFHITLKLLIAVANIFAAKEIANISGKKSAFSYWLLNPFALVVVIGWGFFVQVIVTIFLLLSVKYFKEKKGAFYFGCSCLSYQVIWFLIPFYLVIRVGPPLKKLLKSRSCQFLNKELNECLKWVVIFCSTFLIPLSFFYALDSQALLHALLIDPLIQFRDFSVWKFISLLDLVPPYLLAQLSNYLTYAFIVFALFYSDILFRAQESILPENITRGILLVSLPVFILNYRLGEPYYYFHLLALSIILLGKASFRLFYGLFTLLAYTYFLLSMGFRHILFHYKPWTDYTNLMVGKYNWWFWLDFAGFVFILIISHITMKIYKEEISLTNRKENKFPYIRLLAFGIVAALMLTYVTSPADTYDFVKHVSEARAEYYTPVDALSVPIFEGYLSPNTPIPYVYSTTLGVQGETLNALFMHPPPPNNDSKVGLYLKYKLRIEAPSLLKFKIALDPNVWYKKGDGVIFEIYVEEGNSNPTLLFHKHLNPIVNVSERRWNYYEVDMSKYVGKEVTIIFVTKAGENADWDWAYWGDIKLVKKS